MTSLFIYSIPAILALAAKCAILYFSRAAKLQNSQTRLFFVTLVFSMFLSLAEVSLLNRLFTDPPFAEIVAYFAIAIPSLALLLHLSISLSFDDWNTKRFYPVYAVLYIYVILLEILLLFTPWLITGVEPFNGYSFTRIPGSAYWLFEIFVLVSLVGVLFIPLCGLGQGRSHLARNKCKFWIAATIPMTILIIAVIVQQHWNIHWFNSTVTLPLTLVFFYSVIAYAIHTRRLFDIEFFMPWSKIRRHKMAFYDRIRNMTAQLTNAGSLHDVVGHIAETFRCSVTLVGGPQPVLATAGNSPQLERFPREILKKIDRLVVFEEIAEVMPETHALMKQNGIAAIVPFHAHSEAAASWMFLGKQFSEEVYSPRDFEVVEQLFNRLAELFLDRLLLMRAQLVGAQDEITTLQRRLALAWEQLGDVQKENQLLREQSGPETGEYVTRIKQMQAEMSALQSRLALAWEQLEQIRKGNKFDKKSTDVPAVISDTKTLEEYIAEMETKLIQQALKRCGGNKSKTARLLGLRPNTLHYKLMRYGLGKSDNEIGDAHS